MFSPVTATIEQFGNVNNPPSTHQFIVTLRSMANGVLEQWTEAAIDWDRVRSRVEFWIAHIERQRCYTERSLARGQRKIRDSRSLYREQDELRSRGVEWQEADPSTGDIEPWLKSDELHSSPAQ